MRKNSKPAPKEEPKKVKQLSNSEKAEEFTRDRLEEIAMQIQEGKVAVSPRKRVIEQPPKNEADTPPTTLESVEESLKFMRANLKEQKREQKQVEKQKLARAHELIIKMKKEKEEHLQKIQQQEEDRNLLHSRLFSEDAIGKMREQLNQRVSDKRREIEERIKSIAIRQGQRVHQVAHQQNQYWQRVKQITKQSQSTKQLPSLPNPEAPGRRKSVAQVPRRGSVSVETFKAEGTDPSKMDLYVARAKIGQLDVNLKVIERKNEQRLKKVISSNKELAYKLGGDRNDRSEFIPYQAHKSAHRSKLQGDEFLKESLLRAKTKRRSPQPSPELDSLSMQESIELRAQEKHINKNEQVGRLKENWDRMLSRIKHDEIVQEQGLEVLSSMERRLDRIDGKGMKDRLKRKYEVLEEKSPEVGVQP